MGQLSDLISLKVHARNWSSLEREDFIRSHNYLKGVGEFALKIDPDYGADNDTDNDNVYTASFLYGLL